MADINEFPDVPGYVSIKQAAQMLGITDKRVYRYIDLGRLPAYKSGGVFLLAEEDVRQFKLNPPGRTRTTPPPWRVYNTRSKVLVTEFQVPVRAGERERLVEKLSEIQKANRHTFPGTIARYVIKGDPELSSLHFILIWKDTDMPDDLSRERGFKALKDELSDMLEWDRAEYHTDEALLHT
jgi:excisionase family DNA binding protein